MGFWGFGVLHLMKLIQLMPEEHVAPESLLAEEIAGDDTDNRLNDEIPEDTELENHPDLAEPPE